MMSNYDRDTLRRWLQENHAKVSNMTELALMERNTFWYPSMYEHNGSEMSAVSNTRKVEAIEMTVPTEPLARLVKEAMMYYTLTGYLGE